MQRPVVGFVGVGLMGWGMAKNVVEKGWPLRVVAHRRREAVDDLVGRGAVECASIAELAAQSDVVVLCVTGSPEVEAALAAIRPAARPGLTVIDASTSEPDATAQLAAELAADGIGFFDAPLSRTPAHAWTGELTSFVSGPPELVARWRPLIEAWAAVVIPVGETVGTAHAVKLVNNLVSLGYAALWAECYGTIARLGVEPGTFREIISNSGMNCGNFQNFSKYPVEGDPDQHRFTIANACKDLGYYDRLATRLGVATLMSDGALQTAKLGVAMGLGDRFLPQMVDIVARLNGAKGPA